MVKYKRQHYLTALKWLENVSHCQKYKRRLRKVLGNPKNVISQPSVEKSFRRPSLAIVIRYSLNYDVMNLNFASQEQYGDMSLLSLSSDSDSGLHTMFIESFQFCRDFIILNRVLLLMWSDSWTRLERMYCALFQDHNRREQTIW